MLDAFKLERIGLFALRRPFLSSVALAAATLLAAFGVERLSVSGANIDILSDGSRETEDYDELLSSFRNFNNDAIILIRSDSLGTVEGIENYRDLVFELKFDERVESTLSPFSLLRYDEETGGWRSALPARFRDDAHVAEELEALAEEIPDSRSLIAPGSGSAVIVAYARPELVRDAEVRETVKHLTELAKGFESEGFSVSLAGQPAIRAAMIDSIADDLKRLAPLAGLLAAAMCLLILKAFVPLAVICAAPLASTLWMLGAMGLAGIEINLLTSILPILLVALSLADALYLYLGWASRIHQGMESEKALEDAVGKIGPACVLSSLATSIALFCLVLSGNEGLIRMGATGGIAVLGSLTATLTLTPLSIRLAHRAGHRPKPEGAERFARLTPAVMRFARMPKTAISLGLILCLIGLYARANLDSRFQLVDYLPPQSQIAEDEGFIDETYPGSTPFFAVVRFDPGTHPLDEASIERFRGAIDAIGSVLPSAPLHSLDNLREEVIGSGSEVRRELLDALPANLRSRFLSAERDKALITIFSSAGASAGETRKLIESLKAEFKERGLENHVTLTGYPVLSSIVVPRLMRNLGISLLAVMALSIALIALAARSIRLSLACLIPNLLPILCINLLLFGLGIPLNLSTAAALTVAFGLAVNDSIHLLNQYALDAERMAPVEAMGNALRQVLPAIIASSLVLGTGFAVMLFSNLPAVALFSGVIMATLLFAIAFDALQLPAHILALAPGRKLPERASE